MQLKLNLNLKAIFESKDQDFALKIKFEIKKGKHLFSVLGPFGALKLQNYPIICYIIEHFIDTDFHR
ncbi:hypothetical protein SC206_07495 [Rouxiella sp. T17]|uniref:hypothetical protein n=1 Tax=Rouxiella sp. T17 TaxID=3085684 RepID=UPI002FC58E87